MHQSIDKKNKILIYFIFLLILSTTNGKFSEKKKFSLKIDKINVAGLPSDKNLKIQNELKGIFYQNIIIIGKEEINRITGNIKLAIPNNLKIKK